MLNSYTASSYSPNTDLSCHLLHTPFTSHWTLLPLAPSDLPSALSPSNSQQLSGHLHFRRFTAPRIQNGSQQVHKSSSTLLCSPHPPAPHAHTNIELLENYKYLGVIIDNKLCFEPWIDNLTKKVQQRMYFLRKMNTFNVSSEMMTLFYRAFI